MYYINVKEREISESLSNNKIHNNLKEHKIRRISLCQGQLRQKKGLFIPYPFYTIKKTHVIMTAKIIF